MNFATPYNHSAERSESFATTNDTPSLTQQSDAKDCDINVIMSRYSKTGQLPQITYPAEYGDFTAVNDYRTALDQVRAADEKFHELPATTRAKFNNNPAEFLDFAQNPDNLDQLRELGLAHPSITPHPSEMSPRFDDNNGLPPTEMMQHGNPTANQQPTTVQPAQGTGGQPRNGETQLRQPQGLRPAGPGGSR